MPNAPRLHVRDSVRAGRGNREDGGCEEGNPQACKLTHMLNCEQSQPLLRRSPAQPPAPSRNQPRSAARRPSPCPKPFPQVLAHSPELRDMVEREVATHRALCPHPNILQVRVQACGFTSTSLHSLGQQRAEGSKGAPSGLFNGDQCGVLLVSSQ